MRNEDERSKKIIFTSSCVLNANNKVRELARYGGSCMPILELLNNYGIGVQQMDCPETLYLGINRWSATKNLYDTAGYRRFCRQLAEKQVDYIQSYYEADYEVIAVLWINGSPSCGCEITCFGEDWGGTPMDMGEDSTFVPGTGIFVEELTKEFQRRGIRKPCYYGLDLEDTNIPLENVYQSLKKFLDEKMISEGREERKEDDYGNTNY